jgi:hypothetical protein
LPGLLDGAEESSADHGGGEPPPRDLTCGGGTSQAFDEEIEVQAGIKKELKVRLVAGNSPPPGVKPGEKRDAVKDAAMEIERKF